MTTMMILADAKQKKVGCVLLQASYGTDYRAFDFELLFPSESWFMTPTNEMKLYSFETLEQIIAVSEAMKRFRETERHIADIERLLKERQT